MADITLSVQLETAPGVWLELEDEPNGYSIGANSFSSEQVAHTQRKAGEDLPWFDGAIVTAGKRNLTVTPLEIYVDGVNSHYLFEQRRRAVEAALAQLAFGLKRTINDALVTYSCVQSDYTIQSDQPLIIATQALIQVQLAYQPATTLTVVP